MEKESGRFGSGARKPRIGAVPSWRVTVWAALFAAMCGGPPEPSHTARAQATPDEKPGLVVDSLGFAFVPITPGSFMMGYDGGKKYEAPVHEVTLTKPFEIGKYEVTQAQWKAVMGTEPWIGKQYAEIGAEAPAQGISWLTAQAFLRRLNASDTLHTYRLPTEAEWEYVARAGTDAFFGYTDDPDSLCAYANIADLSAKEKFPEWDSAPCTDGFALAAPVGRLRPNAWGVHDMIGNVWEWVADWYGPYPDGPVTDPKGPAEGDRRVLRGNSWDALVRGARVSNRFVMDPRENSVLFGFRIVREPRTDS
jgi:formylglycine-generating enzyme required for sulfatase activity